MFVCLIKQYLSILIDLLCTKVSFYNILVRSNLLLLYLLLAAISIAPVFALDTKNITSDQSNYDYSYNYDYTYETESNDTNLNQSYDQNVYSKQDLFETVNRKIFNFNLGVDRLILKPAAILYNKITNDYIQNRVSSFYENIKMPITIISYAAQNKFYNATLSFWRCLINTTIGIGGLFDIASEFGLKVEKQNISDILKYYGAKNCIYIVLPFFGGTTGISVGNILSDSRLNLIYFGDKKVFDIKTRDVYYITALDIINKRASVLSISDAIEKNAIDYYAIYRNAVMARDAR